MIPWKFYKHDWYLHARFPNHDGHWRFLLNERRKKNLDIRWETQETWEPRASYRVAVKTDNLIRAFIRLDASAKTVDLLRTIMNIRNDWRSQK